jgi:predicted nucleic acid-binding protein
MILVDSSIWIDHIARAEPVLQDLLNHREVCIHPFIIGEIALGSLANRNRVLVDLKLLPAVGVATHQEVMSFLEQGQLFGMGIGFIDLHLLAAARLAAGTRVWTRDKRLARACLKLDVSAFTPHEVASLENPTSF